MKSIGAIDRRLAVTGQVNGQDFDFFDVRRPPFTLYGLLPGEPGAPFRRMPESVAAAVSEGVAFLNTHTSGGRVRFCTDSARVAVRVQMPQNGRMPHMTALGSSGFDLYVRQEDGTFRYYASFVPPTEYAPVYEAPVYFADSHPRELLIHFPLYDAVDRLEIGVEPEASLTPGTPYRDALPLVFYGSSITQGGCASRPGNSYEAQISRRFNADFVNLGFSGNARGETAVADYLASMKMSLCMLDYDHNSPSAAELDRTHEKLFLTVREKQPDLPILLATKTDPIRDPQMEADEDIRRAIVSRTYENALRRGDKQVRFVDGRYVFSRLADKGLSPYDCTVDGCHPNDLGFFCMAQAFGDAIADLLGW